MTRRVRPPVARTASTPSLPLPVDLLGGLSARRFMAEYWQRKPLLVRQAIPGFVPPVGRDDLFKLAAREDVESRCVISARADGQAWELRRGPFRPRALPSVRQPGWSLLVQGVDAQHEGVAGLKQALNFIPSARLDDVMISYATDGGGVGPHFDSYDVFLLQAHGRRRWRIGPQRDLRLRDDLPLKILSHFKPEMEWVLEPGDMLYLPPRYAHDGIAEGECMTWSIGFRSPQAGELARELLQSLADEAGELVGDAVYRDPAQPAVANPAAIPAELMDFAREALQRAQNDPQVLAMLLGEHLSEPKANVWFDTEAAVHWAPGQGVVLNRRTRMLYDAQHIFINGEGFRVTGKDARLLRQLADRRALSAKEGLALSPDAQQALIEWSAAAWVSAV